MEKFYRIQFTATLLKMTLAFKMECDIQVFWKRGQKVAQTGKVLFRNCAASFDKQLTISCNMVFDCQRKLFKQKQTKFAIVIFTEKGNKQAGQVVFDVAPFLNQRNKSKDYEVGLTKCPDKNAKLCFSLKAQIMQEKSFDTISQSSQISVDIQNLAANKVSQIPYTKPQNNVVLQAHSLPHSDNKSSTSIMSKKREKSAEIVPTTDRFYDKNKSQSENNSNTQRHQNTAQMIKKLQNQNKKIRQQLKKKQSIKKQNQELKRRLKDDDYQSCKQYKKKIQQGKKQIQHLNQESKGAKKINQDIKNLQKQILKCKQHIMIIFNDAQKFGPQSMDKIQQACGIKQY